jgi:hypothetical protein
MLIRGISVMAAVAVAFPLTMMAVHAKDSSVQLKGDEIVAAMTGHKVSGVTSKGDKWTAVYKADGTAEFSGGKTGTWMLKDDMFCDHPKGDQEYCRTVWKISAKKFQLRKENGAKGSTVTIE